MNLFFQFFVLVLILIPAGLKAEQSDYYESVADLHGKFLKIGLQRIISWNKKLKEDEAANYLSIIFKDPDNVDNLILFHNGKSIFKARKYFPRNPDGNSWAIYYVWPLEKVSGSIDAAFKTDLHNMRLDEYAFISLISKSDLDTGLDFNLNYPGSYFKQNIFEPSDDLKGDIARVIFYDAVRYPDLQIVNTVTALNRNSIGLLCRLLEWSALDKVSDDEKKINDRIFMAQNNKNPFVDHPEWADDIWGSECR